MLSSSLFISCEDDEKDPFIIEEQVENFAPYVRFLLDTPVIDVTAVDTGDVVYSGTLSAPAENVASWSVEVRKIRGTDTIPYASLASFTSFPADLALTGQDIADALGVPLSEVQAGDKLEFNAVSTGTNGTELRFEDWDQTFSVSLNSFKHTSLMYLLVAPLFKRMLWAHTPPR